MTQYWPASRSLDGLLTGPDRSPQGRTAAPAPAPAPAAGRKGLRSLLSARAAVQEPGTDRVAGVAASTPPFPDPQELRSEGIRLLTELSGEDLEHGVRQLRSLRARSRRD